MTPAERLATNLAAQRGATAELERLLEQERAALDQRHWSTILDLADVKAAAARRLQNLVAELRTLTAGRDPAAAAFDAGLSDPWQALLTHAAQLQRLNRELRTRLDAHQARIAAALRIMSRAVDGSGLYGRDGRAGFAPSVQPLARA